MGWERGHGAEHGGAALGRSLAPSGPACLPAPAPPGGRTRSGFYSTLRNGDESTEGWVAVPIFKGEFGEKDSPQLPRSTTSPSPSRSKQQNKAASLPLCHSHGDL